MNSPNISYPWNKNQEKMLTHENQNWTNEISKRKSVGPTKYPRERDSNPRNTYEKKISGSQKDDDMIARARSRRPTMVRNSRNLAHSSTILKNWWKKLKRMFVFITCSLYCFVCRNSKLRHINALFYSNFNSSTMNGNH